MRKRAPDDEERARAWGDKRRNGECDVTFISLFIYLYYFSLLYLQFVCMIVLRGTAPRPGGGRDESC